MGSPWYVTRDAVKNALGLPSSTTGVATGPSGLTNRDLDLTIEAVSRQFEQYLGFSGHPASETRDFSPLRSDYVRLDYPLLAVDSIQTDADGNASYETTLTTSDYYLNPANATLGPMPQPFWGVEARYNSTAVFPVKIPRSVRIAGTWGFVDKRRTSSGDLATALSATATSIEVSNSTGFQVGQTILMGSEQMFITGTPASSSGTVTTGSITVTRAVNGTTNATHSSATGISIYEYPGIEDAALFQAMQNWRAHDAPLGFTGGEPFGTERAQLGMGLHPFTRRILDQMRKPVAV